MDSSDSSVRFNTILDTIFDFRPYCKQNSQFLHVNPRYGFNLQSPSHIRNYCIRVM